MFIDYTILKKLMKIAYKEDGLTVTNGLNVIIMSYNWGISVNRDYLTKEAKGPLIEIIGDLPEVGTAVTYHKDGDKQQTQLENIGIIQAYAEQDETGYIYKPLQVNILWNKNEYVVFEKNEDTDKVVANSIYLKLVNLMNIDDRNGETLPGDWFRTRNYINIENNVMKLWCSCYTPENDQISAILDVLSTAQLAR